MSAVSNFGRDKFVSEAKNYEENPGEEKVIPAPAPSIYK